MSASAHYLHSHEIINIIWTYTVNSILVFKIMTNMVICKRCIIFKSITEGIMGAWAVNTGHFSEIRSKCVKALICPQHKHFFKFQCLSESILAETSLVPCV